MATYKTGWIKKLINGVSTKIFAISHVKAIYYDYANSKTLKTKLDEMDTSINGKSPSNHTHNNFVKSGSGAKAGFVPAPSTTAGTTKYLREDGTWTVPPDTNTTYPDATTSAHGLMTAADKSKLNGIASGANKTTVDSSLSSTSTNPVQNKVINNALNTHTHRYLKAIAGSLGSRTVDLYVDTTFRLRPNISGGVALGDGTVKWGQIYSTNSAISTSDKNYKKNIKGLKEDERFYLLFKKLAPVSYLFTDGTSGRTHVGFIAQDVEDAMQEVGLTDLDFAGFCKDVKMKATEEKDKDGNVIFVKDLDEYGNEKYVYALRYEEFIAINTMMIQKLDEKQSELEEKVNQLFDHLNLN